MWKSCAVGRATPRGSSRTRPVRVRSISWGSVSLRQPLPDQRPQLQTVGEPLPCHPAHPRDETPLVLCGDSYDGMVIAGVADRLGDRLDQPVLIDAYVSDDGDWRAR